VPASGRYQQQLRCRALDFFQLHRRHVVHPRTISTRVNKPENDDPSVIEPIEQSAA
jgi:hypothetical protein